LKFPPTPYSLKMTIESGSRYGQGISVFNIRNWQKYVGSCRAKKSW
jgi:hypothetical protein